MRKQGTTYEACYRTCYSRTVDTLPARFGYQSCPEVLPHDHQLPLPCPDGRNGGDGSVSNVIQFPVDKTEHYTIAYDPVSHAVEIPLVPDEVMSAVCILAVFIDSLIDQGTLTADEVLQVVLQATGNL